MKKINAGYEIIDHMSLAGEYVVIGHNPNPNTPAPYVTWKTNEQLDTFFYGHYFADYNSAVLSMIRRAAEDLDFGEQTLSKQTIGRALLTQEDKDALESEFREANSREDICSILADVIENDPDKAYDYEALIHDESFMAKALHRYYNVDHSFENEALADTLTDLLEEFPQYAQALEASVKISPEYAELLNDLMSMPSAKIPVKYGPLGDNPEFFFDLPNDMSASLELQPSYNYYGTDLSETTPPIAVVQICDKDGSAIFVRTFQADDLQYLFTGEYEFNFLNNRSVKLSLEADETQRRLGNQFVFKSSSTEERYTDHNGELCTIERALTAKECDVLCTGLMWEARFPNGDVMHVFDDELNLPEPGKRIRPSLASQIQTAQAKGTQASPPTKEAEKDLGR